MEIGALIVSLRANSAQFRAEIDNARKSTTSLGTEFGKTQRLATSFATTGLATLVPELQGAEMWIGRFVQGALRAGPAMLFAGKAAVVLGAALGAVKLGSMLGDFVFGGDRVKALQEETQAFEKWQVTTSGIRRREARAAVVEEAKALADRRKARDDYDVALIKQINDERQAQTKAWLDEATAYRDHLKGRLDARKEFEANIGKGGIGGTADKLGGGLAGGFGSIRDLAAKRDKELRDLAFLKDQGFITETSAMNEREGIRRAFMEEVTRLREVYRAFPEVLDALQVAADRVDFSNLSAGMETGRMELEKLGIATDGTINSLADFHSWLDNGIPAAVQKTDSELAVLNQWLVYTKANFDAAAQSAKEFAGAGA